MRSKSFDIQHAQSKALAVFWQKGYAGTSMDDLLSSMALSRSSFYNAFGDKRQLYQTVLQNFGLLTTMAVSALSKKKPVRECLLDFFELSFCAHGTPAAQGCLLVNTVLEQAAHDTELAMEAAKYLARVEQAIEEALEKAVERGELKKNQNPKALASVLMTIVKGLRVSGKEGQSLEQLRETFSAALAILSV